MEALGDKITKTIIKVPFSKLQQQEGKSFLSAPFYFVPFSSVDQTNDPAFFLQTIDSRFWK